MKASLRVELTTLVFGLDEGCFQVDDVQHTYNHIDHSDSDWSYAFYSMADGENVDYI